MTFFTHVLQDEYQVIRGMNDILLLIEKANRIDLLPVVHTLYNCYMKSINHTETLIYQRVGSDSFQVQLQVDAE